MRILEPLCIDAIPNLAFKKPARYQLLFSELIRTDAHASASLFEAIRHKYRDWLHSCAHKFDVVLSLQVRCRLVLLPMYVFTFEAPNSQHVNWVLRIPPAFLDDFQRKLPIWIGRVQPIRDHDLSVQRLEPGAPYKALVNYICKGCEPAFTDHFHLTAMHAEHGNQGTFWGKRDAVSPALNKTARDAVGYNAK